MNPLRLASILFVLVLQPSVAFSQMHGTAIPNSISIQGYLTDSTGVPIDTTKEMTLEFTGPVSYGYVTSAIVENGVFNIAVPQIIMKNLVFNETVYLQVQVDGEIVIPPTPFRSSPYALAVVGMFAQKKSQGLYTGYNIVHGSWENTISDTIVGGTIGGGGGLYNGGSIPNQVTGDWGTVAGGHSNTASNFAGTVGGGIQNFASSGYSTVGGGQGNRAIGVHATVAGGYADTASTSYAVVSGGKQNRAAGVSSTIGGGEQNKAGDQYAVVSGGGYNRAGAQGSAVGGGASNEATGNYSVVAGGTTNKAISFASSVGGGSGNTASGSQATVAGGDSNAASGLSSVVGGGSYNKATGNTSIVPGGFENQARGGNSFAAGYRARAKHDGSFVWNHFSGSSDSLVTTASNQFLVRADGGVGIGTNAPDRPLSIECLSGSCQWISFKNSSGATKWHINHANNGFHISETGVSDNRLFIEPGGNVGIGTGDPVERLHVAGNYYGRGHVFLYAYEGDGSSGTAYIQARDKTASTTIGMTLRTQDAGTVKDAVTIASNGDVHVLGNLSKGGGSFKIDHPLDPENKYLYHSFVESPDMKNVYDGVVTLDEKGEATVELPSYFEALNKDFRYQLTCIGGFAPVYVSNKISGNRFSIAGGDAGMEVSWMITGIRKDPYAEKHRIPVEVDKPDSERGTYLHPDVYAGTR